MNDVECIVMHEFTVNDLMAMKPPVPYAIQVRQALNKVGFKFKDDGKLISIVNETPEPIGTLVSWYDIESMVTYYKQTYSA